MGTEVGRGWGKERRSGLFPVAWQGWRPRRRAGSSWRAMPRPGAGSAAGSSGAVHARCLVAVGMAVLLSAVFWLPPFLRNGADLEELDSQVGTNIIASFQLPKPVAELKVNIQELQYDIFEEIDVVKSSVTIISLDALPAKNWMNVLLVSGLIQKIQTYLLQGLAFLGPILSCW